MTECNSFSNGYDCPPSKYRKEIEEYYSRGFNTQGCNCGGQSPCGCGGKSSGGRGGNSPCGCGGSPKCGCDDSLPMLVDCDTCNSVKGVSVNCNCGKGGNKDCGSGGCTVFDLVVSIISFLMTIMLFTFYVVFKFWMTYFETLFNLFNNYRTNKFVIAGCGMFILLICYNIVRHKFIL